MRKEEKRRGHLISSLQGCAHRVATPFDLFASLMRRPLLIGCLSSPGLVPFFSTYTPLRVKAPCLPALAAPPIALKPLGYVPMVGHRAVFAERFYALLRRDSWRRAL